MVNRGEQSESNAEVSEERGGEDGGRTGATLVFTQRAGAV